MELIGCPQGGAVGKEVEMVGGLSTTRQGV